MKPINIVFTNNGNRAKRSYNWLLSQESDWAMDANPFIIMDPDIRQKVEGLTYNNAPVSEQLIRKYPKHGLQLYFSNETAKEKEIWETEEVNLEELVTKGISEIKMTIDEADVDIDKLIELETANKNRKTLIDYLNGIK